MNALEKILSKKNHELTALEECIAEAAQEDSTWGRSTSKLAAELLEESNQLIETLVLALVICHNTEFSLREQLKRQKNALNQHERWVEKYNE